VHPCVGHDLARGCEHRDSATAWAAGPAGREPTAAQEREDQWLGLCWKTRTVVGWAPGRPFAWVDDEITGADRDWVTGNHPGPALLRSVDASRGLTDQDFTALDAWLSGLP
jgi:hypothetical protein